MSKFDQDTNFGNSNSANLRNQTNFDDHIYDSGDRFEGYLPSVHLIDHHEDEDVLGVQTDIPVNMNLTEFSNIENSNILLDKYDQRKVITHFISFIFYF